MDFYIFGGKYLFLEYFCVMGYELLGMVEVVFEGSDLQLGDLVYIVFYLFCGDCQVCCIGLINVCCNICVLGVYIDGGMVECILVLVQNVILIGGIVLCDVVMIEFLVIGVYGVLCGYIVVYDWVLVIGVGFIGMLVIIFVKVCGVYVMVMDMCEDWLVFVIGGLGVDVSVIVISDQVDVLVWGDGFDVVIDVIGVVVLMMCGFDFLVYGVCYVLLFVVW